MEFIQDNIVVQIILLVVGLGIAGYFGWRSYKNAQNRSKKKKGL